MKLLKSTFWILLFLYSCSDSKTLEERLAVELDNVSIIKKGPISIFPVVYKKKYFLEQLTLKTEEISKSGNVLSLEFEEDLPVGYEIHYTVNNGQLSRSTSSNLEVELLEGNNVVVAFLSLANGLRIPNENAVYVKNHFVGNETQGDVIGKGLHLFHNVSYRGDSADFYIDFYGKNVPEKSNYFARVIVDGNQFNMQLNKAFKLSGLTKEYHNLRIQLVDGNGNVVDGPFNDTGVISVEVK